MPEVRGVGSGSAFVAPPPGRRPGLPGGQDPPLRSFLAPGGQSQPLPAGQPRPPSRTRRRLFVITWVGWRRGRGRAARRRAPPPPPPPRRRGGGGARPRPPPPAVWGGGG